MHSALPPALSERDAGLDLFRTLEQLIRNEGARIAYGDLAGDAHWDAATQTLTLRAHATPADQTWALGEFCRYRLGPDYSHFTPTPTRRHLYAVT